MKIGILGAGSWATAIAKILVDNQFSINWWIRNERTIEVFKKRKHNPRYMESISFPMRKLRLFTDSEEVIRRSDVLLCVIPSANVSAPFEALSDPSLLAGKYIVSATKGVIPEKDQLLNQYLVEKFAFPTTNYAAIMGPCHAEEVALEKLSYLTIASENMDLREKIAKALKTNYIITRTSSDILGVQYAAVLKNIYAVGAGIAHGLRYGDNFLSVYNANAQREMSEFLQALSKYYKLPEGQYNYADSVYLGDLLVTCYSPYSRNREFGTFLGKGYSARSAKMEMNMTAEGYTTSKGIYMLNKKVKAHTPILRAIYEIVWQKIDAELGFKKLEQHLI